MDYFGIYEPMQATPNFVFDANFWMNLCSFIIGVLFWQSFRTDMDIYRERRDELELVRFEVIRGICQEARNELKQIREATLRIRRRSRNGVEKTEVGTTSDGGEA